MEPELSELSVRTQDKGGGVYQGMYFRGERGRLTDSRLIILVHGFNVDLAGAQQTYRKFCQDLSTQVGPTPLSRYGTFIGFYWPGDHQAWAASVPTFPVRIPMTRDVGRQLAKFIHKCLGPDQEVFFVAHSLGCRVVLDTLLAIAEIEDLGVKTRATVSGVFLMAGAVPYHLCEGGEPFKRRDPKLRDWVIHSAEDEVLAKAFPRGEWLVGEGGGEAIGRHGWPPKRWHRSVLTKLGHGDYWTAWPLVMENIPAMLGRAAPHQLSEWPESSRPATPRANRLSASPLKERKLGSPLGSGWEILVKPV
jgi:Alpha/beta hydrolase of unknown function (DUF900)